MPREDVVNTEFHLHSLNSEELLKLSLVRPASADLTKISSHIIHNYNYNTRPIQQINTNKARICRLNDPSIKILLGASPFLIKLSFQDKDQYGILTHFKDEFFILNYMSSIFDSESGTSKLSNLHFTDELNISWKLSLTTSKKNSFTLSMKPPIQTSPIKKVETDDARITDPFDYLVHSYFSTLYQLTTPLIFFAKSSFPKLRSLCTTSDSQASYEAILKLFLLSFEQFDSRHLVSNNGILNSDPIFEVESPFRDEFISKSLNLVDFDIHSVNYSDTNKSLSDLLSKFKLREIHLQIMLLLELIYVSDRDDPKYLKEKVQKKSLIRKKLVGKKKVTPTLIGATIWTDSAPVKSSKMPSYNQLLDSYIDKLSIWEMLNSSNGSSSIAPISSSISEHSSGKFIKYVIIPYFDKKCHNSVKLLVQKIKGPSFKSSPSSKSESKTKSKLAVQTAGLKRVAPVQETSSDQFIKSSLSRSSSILEDIDEFKLQRTKSDLQSFKRTSSFTVSSLSKRQIDISSRPSQSNLASQDKATKSNSTQSIFNRVGKRILTSSTKLQSDMAISQVEETPMKKQKVIDVIETPGGLQMGQSPDNLFVHSSSSPIKYINTPKVSLQSPLVIRSTAKQSNTEKSIFSFESTGDPKNNDSPVKEKVRRRLFAPP